VHRPILAIAFAGTALAAYSPDARADGAPAIAVKELSTRGVLIPGPYLLALNRRGPMLATCFGTREAMEAVDPFEAFMTVGLDGRPSLVSLQGTDQTAGEDLDGCLVRQLDKARFPEANRAVELSVILAPAVKPDERRRR
jgi:hypothetical protein